jgi:hypothetical protein
MTAVGDRKKGKEEDEEGERERANTPQTEHHNSTARSDGTEGINLPHVI